MKLPFKKNEVLLFISCRENYQTDKWHDEKSRLKLCHEKKTKSELSGIPVK